MQKLIILCGLFLVLSSVHAHDLIADATDNGESVKYWILENEN
tara:strand:+ start:471 stop:599 length:129 start_codon:yes stop_codon:yes gene_type:complete